MRKLNFLIVICILLPACATVFDKTRDKISFTSEPSEANIHLNGRLMGKTPVSFEVPRNLFSERPLITVEKEGYKKQEFKLSRDFNKVAIWNLTSLYSWTTDVVSGAVLKYSPTDYRLILEGEHATSTLQDIEVIKFVFFNFDNIQEDIAKGGGEYLESMVFLNVSLNNKNVFIQQILNELDYLKVQSPSELIYLLKRDRQLFKS